MHNNSLAIGQGSVCSFIFLLNLATGHVFCHREDAKKKGQLFFFFFFRVIFERPWFLDVWLGYFRAGCHYPGNQMYRQPKSLKAFQKKKNHLKIQFCSAAPKQQGNNCKLSRGFIFSILHQFLTKIKYVLWIEKDGVCCLLLFVLM